MTYKNKEDAVAYGKTYRLNNKNKEFKRKQAWKLANKEHIKEQSKVYNLVNKDKIAQQKKQYYLKNKERILAKNKAYNKANREKISIVESLWRQNNKGKVASNTRRYQVSKMNRTPKWLTKDDLWLIKEAYELAALRTKVFGFSWHVDHIIPLQGKLVSGLHVIENLQVIPGIENKIKMNSFELDHA